jgi:hypothetical protein
MGRKSRLKKERKQGAFEGELRRHPMREEIRTFLEKRRVAMDKASGLLYVVSLMGSFMIHRSIKRQTQLPVISPEEEKADKNRFESLGMILEHECRQLHIEPQEIMGELVFPMAGNKALMEPILTRIYEMFDSLIVSDSFRQPTEAQIENPELWGDSLMHYADRKEEYFQAVNELFALVLAIARSTLDEELKMRDQEKRLEEIRKTYEIEPDDFQKLRRRATEFFKIAFAKYLSMVFQPLREEVDNKIY